MCMHACGRDTEWQVDLHGDDSEFSTQTSCSLPDKHIQRQMGLSLGGPRHCKPERPRGETTVSLHVSIWQCHPLRHPGQKPRRHTQHPFPSDHVPHTESCTLCCSVALRSEPSPPTWVLPGWCWGRHYFSPEWPVVSPLNRSNSTCLTGWLWRIKQHKATTSSLLKIHPFNTVCVHYFQISAWC